MMHSVSRCECRLQADMIVHNTLAAEQFDDCIAHSQILLELYTLAPKSYHCARLLIESLPNAVSPLSMRLWSVQCGETLCVQATCPELSCKQGVPAYIALQALRACSAIN